MRLRFFPTSLGVSEPVRGAMGLPVAAQAAQQEPRRLRRSTGTAGGWLRITLLSFLATLPVEQLRAFPSSLSDCQTPTGWNCSGEIMTRVTVSWFSLCIIDKVSGDRS